MVRRVVLFATWAVLMPAAARATAVETPAPLLDEAYLRKTTRDLSGAASAFAAARNAGADPQFVALELAYLAMAQGDMSPARELLRDAAVGPNLVVADQARRELGSLPGPFWGELYADTFGWSRAYGASKTADLVPT